MEAAAGAAGLARSIKVDSFGCQTRKLDNDRYISGGGIDYFRKTASSAPPGQVFTPASDRGVLVGLSLKPGHRRRIFHEHHVSDHDFSENGVYVRGFDEDYSAELSGSFGFVLMEISPADLDTLCDATDTPSSSRCMTTVTGVPD